MNRRTEPSETVYIATPHGIFTPSGLHFHTTEQQLEQYAGDVLRHVPLDDLVRETDAWLDAPRTLVLWVLPTLLVVASPATAAAVSLALYLLVAVLSPGLVLRPLVHVVQHLATVPAQGAYYVLMLSLLAVQDQMAAVVVGLAGFILLRWGLIDWLTSPLTARIMQRLYPLPPADQVLRALIVRVALRYDVELPELDRLKQSFDRRHP